VLGKTIPLVTFKTRIRDESLGGDNPFKWKEVTSREIFPHGKRIVAFPARSLHTDLF
jgi:peroxiredoxin